VKPAEGGNNALNSFVWTVPAGWKASTKVKVRVIGNSVADFCDGYFAIN